MAFHITKVTATGTSKQPATITFNKGLNIICGVSDSGKTCVLKCIQFARQRLKWDTLMRFFWFKEENIENPKSVLWPSSPTQLPYFFASLLYLITGDNYPDGEEQDKDAVSKAKRDAVRQFVNGRISQMSKKREELQKALSAYSDLDVEEEMQKFIDNLSETETAITAATEESKDLLSTLLVLKENEAENQVTYSHFQSLKSQNTADIKRLSFIVDGEVHLHAVGQNKKCPFCEGNSTCRKKVLC